MRPQLVRHIGGHLVGGRFGHAVDHVAQMLLRRPEADVDDQPAAPRRHQPGRVRGGFFIAQVVAANPHDAIRKVRAVDVAAGGEDVKPGFCQADGGAASDSAAGSRDYGDHCIRLSAMSHFRKITFALALALALTAAGQQFNPDGSLRPANPVSRLFTQDAYTEYAILAPGSEQFRIRFLPEENRAGATELVNATRGGSEGSDIEVYDPRTGKPLKFTYQQQGNDPENHAIHATLPMPVPPGGIGRVLIYKTYKDARTYMMHGDDIVWVRSLSGYRLGVVLPKGFAFISSNVAAQLTTLADGRLKLAFRQPQRPEQSGDDPRAQDGRQLHAASLHRHVLRRHQDALRSGCAGNALHPRGADLQRLSQGRQGPARFAGVPPAAGPQGGRPGHREGVHSGEGRPGHGGQAGGADRR
ncbi:hypothetical protein SBA4_970021 [Candidatus Sulfopaludibacter sp. SbA4]|nr:hypothetical protein SBA4_970021 [Candidatus Sulfopaludibacter sp. SbA4]